MTNHCLRFFARAALALAVPLITPAPAWSQTPAAPGDPPESSQQPADHDHMHMDMTDATGWHFMQDGVLFGVYNRQGGPRGGNEFTAPNWWMGMLSRKLKRSDLTFNTMFSLEPASVGEDGYREIFQVGETLDGRPLVDRQHPHDLFMQLAGIWRLALSSTTGVTLAGGPVGEPALGPVAFMHRASAAGNPFAPLSHHTFDSTHVAFGVVTAAIDHGPWTIEGSVFNGREPDQHRWDFDFAPLDSVSARVWFAPGPKWEFQVSSGRLKDPEALEPGNLTRTTASAGWVSVAGDDLSAITVGVGVNATAGARRHAFFAEGTRRAGKNAAFGRFEVVEAETAALLGATGPDADHARANPIGALTLGGVRDVVRSHGLEAALGAAVTLYAVPDPLTITHGNHPVSFQLFVRIRPSGGSAGRMLNMRMSQPLKSMPGGKMMHDHMN